MEFYFELISIFFFGISKLIQSQKICGNNRDDLVCCSNYRFENGKCVVCPPGYYSVNCSRQCPSGFFGEFCAKRCICTEFEICDIAHGCVDKSTEVEHLTSSLLTIELTTDLRDPESKRELPAVPFLLYLVSLGSLSVLCIICLPLICRILCCRNIRHWRRGIHENRNATVASPRQEESSRPEVSNVDYELPRHEYIEIIDVDSTYLEPCSVTTEDEK